jgi:hypothetical protein
VSKFEGRPAKTAELERVLLPELQGKEKALGVEHPSTLDIVYSLGILYTNQGKVAEAEQMFQQVLQCREKALGIEHTSTLKTVNNLGCLYAN